MWASALRTGADRWARAVVVSHGVSLALVVLVVVTAGVGGVGARPLADPLELRHELFDLGPCAANAPVQLVDYGGGPLKASHQ